MQSKSCLTQVGSLVLFTLFGLILLVIPRQMKCHIRDRISVVQFVNAVLTFHISAGNLIVSVGTSGKTPISIH